MPHFKVRNPLLEGPLKGRVTKRYSYATGKCVLLLVDKKRSPDPKKKKA